MQPLLRSEGAALIAVVFVEGDRPRRDDCRLQCSCDADNGMIVACKLIVAVTIAFKAMTLVLWAGTTEL